MNEGRGRGLGTLDGDCYVFIKKYYGPLSRTGNKMDYFLLYISFLCLTFPG